jgi:hypothetical protein
VLDRGGGVVTAIRRFVAGWLPLSALPVAAAVVVAAVLAAAGAWIAAALACMVGAYLAGRADVVRADERLIAARIAAATRPLAEQLDRYERFVVELGEADHAAIVDPRPARRPGEFVNAAYRSSRRTYDSPVRPVGVTSTNGAK